MTDFNPDVLLAYNRARQKAASTRANAALARLGGGESRPRRSLDDLTVDEIESDTRTLRAVAKAWKRKRLRLSGKATSTIKLPSGRQLVYDWGKEEVVK